MTDETESRWAARVETLGGFRGYFLRNVAYLALPQDDLVDIGLMSTPDEPEVTIKAEGVFHFSIEKSGELSGAFVDDFVFHYIPRTSASWPAGIEGVLGPRPGSLPDLFWLQLVGPVEVSVVARFLTVAVSK